MCIYLNKLASGASGHSGPRVQLAGLLQLAGPSWQAYCMLCCSCQAHSRLSCIWQACSRAPNVFGRPTAGYAGQAFCRWLAPVGKPTAGYAAVAKPIAGFPTRFPGAGLLQQVCNNKVSRDRFATAGSTRQGFHGQVYYSRHATTKFPWAGLQQQVCNNKVSRGRFATAGLPQQGFHG